MVLHRPHRHANPTSAPPQTTAQQTSRAQPNPASQLLNAVVYFVDSLMNTVASASNAVAQYCPILCIPLLILLVVLYVLERGLERGLTELRIMLARLLNL